MEENRNCGTTHNQKSPEKVLVKLDRAASQAETALMRVPRSGLSRTCLKWVSVETDVWGSVWVTAVLDTHSYKI